jgi:hypothetical protein
MVCKHTNTEDYVAYCFAEVEGFSKFGSYTGNGSADGPFVYTGFRPAWVMFKDFYSGGDWLLMFDNEALYNSQTNFVAKSLMQKLVMETEY